MKARLSPLAILCLLGCSCLVPPAQAAYDPLGSGQTRLTLDKSFLSLMKQANVKLSATAPAKLRGATVSFPVVGGKFDPRAARGTIEHEGALVFRAGRRSIPIKDLQLKTTSKRAPLSAKVGGSQLKLAETEGLAVSRDGFGDEIKVPGLTLSAKLATRLGKKLRLKETFKQGLAFGRTASTANPLTISLLSQGKAELNLAPSLQAKLNDLFVAVNPIFAAEHPAGPTFTLPIAGGTIAPDASQGTVQTEGALEFIQLGGGQVFWSEAWLDFEAKTFAPEVETKPSPPFGGKAGRLGVSALAAGAVSADPTARTVAISGVLLSLDGGSAQTFNEVFAKPQGESGVFAAGEAVGTVSLVGSGQ